LSRFSRLGGDVKKSKEEFAMTVIRKRLATIVFAAAMGLAATPSFAVTVDGTVHMSAARAAALRECNGRAEAYSQYLWGVTQLQIYRACMAEHHQME
jgi:hypothetical protein